MFNRRQIALLAAGACLLLVSGAAAAEGDAFTVTGTPSHVKPTTSAAYTITLTNDPSSPSRGQRAKIAIPPGFSVDPLTVQAISQALGGCDASTWEADGVLLADSKINLKRPGNNDTGLCPGANLTISFDATSANSQGTYEWTTQLLADAEFALNGAQPTVTVDGTAPETTITSIGPPASTKSTSASFSFSSSEAASTFECSLDGAAFAACTSPKNYAGLDEDTHTFAVRATDPAGNTDATPAGRSWTVDLTAPDTTITSIGPPSWTNKTHATFSFSSTEAGSAFECSLDDAAFAECTSPESYPGLAGGPHTFEVRAVDPAENTDASPAERSWTIDLAGAATTILTAPPSATNSSSASFTFTSSEPGSTTFECSLDRALFTPCNNPISYSSLADGMHTFAVRAVDAAENTGPEATHNWTIDTRPPTATVTGGPPALANDRSASFAFTADEPSSFQCSLDGGSFVPCSSPVSYSGLSDGGHTFVARPTDGVGNPGASSSYSWTIDATAPETTLGSGPRSGTTTVSATFTFSASESAGFQCKLDASAFATCSSPKSYGGLTRSAHSFEVRAIDSAGNLDATPVVHRWTIAAAPRALKATSALLSPRAGATVTSPPLLRWRRVARASYYNVQLYRGRVKVLSVWPTRTRLQLRARWTYLGRTRRLTPGAYRWYVWPGYGPAPARRYGSLLGQSRFRVR